MRLLIDNCVPRKFARLITDHEVLHARQMGWHELQNGLLIAAAERDGFQAIVTTDKNLQVTTTNPLLPSPNGAK